LQMIKGQQNRKTVVSAQVLELIQS